CRELSHIRTHFQVAGLSCCDVEEGRSDIKEFRVVVPYPEADEEELPLGELRHADLALYRSVLNRRTVDVAELRSRAALLADAGVEAVDRLLAFGLFRPARGKPGVLEVNSPHSEAPIKLDAMLHQVRTRQAALDSIRAELVALG